MKNIENNIIYDKSFSFALNISESKIILLNNQLNEISKILNPIITTTKENLKQNNA
jgi:hypothetical protein